jgi:multidrug efflux pump subunit AcrA (membrane-fusion protein)
VGDLADLAANYLKNRQMRQMASQQRMWNQLETFTHQIHHTLDFKETAYAVVNDGKRLVGCDRMSVALKLSGRTMVEAISGQEVVEQRSNQVRELTKLCKAVIRSGEDLVYTGHTEGFAPDLRDALELYVDESGSKAVAVVLLYKPEKEEGAERKEKVPYGCLVSEQIGDEVAPTDMHARTEVVARHSSTALWNSQEHHRIFLRPVLKAMGSPWRLLRGRTLAKILAVLGLIVALIGVLTFVPWNLRIEGRGSLMPEQRSIVYAPDQGIIAEVPVEHGARVKKGDLIARLDSRKLDRELKELQAQHNKATSQGLILQQQEQAASQREQNRQEGLQLVAQRTEAQITAKSTAQQIEIVKEQLDELSIRAPHDGIITTWEVKKNLLGRPVDIGTELLQLAETEGEWVLEVEVPDDDMGPVLAAQAKLEDEVKAGTKQPGAALSAYFVVMTEPEHRYQGYVRRIASKAETKPESAEQRHTVKVTVGFNEAVRNEFLARNQEFRPGAEVRARIDCGDARLAYVLFRKVVQVWHESVLFRWPFLR